jgi:hypothetical protein
VRRIDRRGFVKAASGAMVTAPLRAFGVAETVAPIRVGIVSEPGGDHLGIYLRTLGKCRGVEQVALADATGGTFGMAKELLGPLAPGLRTFKAGTQRFAYESDPPGYDFGLQAAVDAARGSAPFITTAESLHVLRVIFGAYQAAESGVARAVG